MKLLSLLLLTLTINSYAQDSSLVIKAHKDFITGKSSTELVTSVITLENLNTSHIQEEYGQPFLSLILQKEVVDSFCYQGNSNDIIELFSNMVVLMGCSCDPWPSKSKMDGSTIHFTFSSEYQYGEMQFYPVEIPLCK